MVAPVSEKEYLDRLSRGVYYESPLLYVQDVFADPRRPGHAVVPDKWQADVLDEIGKCQMLSVTSGHGIGKALGNNELIQTPTGPVKHGDIQPGDYVFGADGRPVEVIATVGWKNVPMYRITFDDGSETTCSSGHLWNVRGRQERRNGVPGWRTIETIELARLGVKRPNGKAMAAQWEIPAQGPAEFATQPVPVAPYTTGVLLGDGHLASSSVVTEDDEILAGVQADGYKTTFAGMNGNAVQFRVLGVRGLLGLALSQDKRVPQEYLFNSIPVRLAVLQGLMDTDGTVGKQGSATFTSTSKGLVEDVIWLVRSLGGKATLQPAVKAPFYRDSGGNKVMCKPAYNATLRLPGMDLFRVQRKLDRIVEAQARYNVRWIESIEPCGVEDAQCLTVANPDGLYLGNDFLVTHNTALSSWLIHWFIATRDHPTIKVTANTANQLTSNTWRELKRWNDVAVNGNHFAWSATRFKHRADPETWFAAAIPWSEHNSEAFAGTHETRGVLMLFDEASAIADVIFDVAQGALTTEGAKMVMFGNPTRTTGYFRETFEGGKYSHRWKNYKVDSRTAKMTDKKLLAEWAEDYGEDSDFFRVRVRGEFPRQSTTQFISEEHVANAMGRALEPRIYAREQKIIGVDVAKGGGSGDRHAICRRQGRKAWDPKPLIEGRHGGIPVHRPGAILQPAHRTVGSRPAVAARRGGSRPQ